MEYRMKRVKAIASRDYEIGDGYMVTIRKNDNDKCFDVFGSHKDYGTLHFCFGLAYSNFQRIAWEEAESIVLCNLPGIIGIVHYEDNICDEDGEVNE